MADEIVGTESKKRSKNKESVQSKFIRVPDIYNVPCWLNLDSIVLISESGTGSYTLHCNDSNAYTVNDKELIAHLID